MYCPQYNTFFKYPQKEQFKHVEAEEASKKDHLLLCIYYQKCLAINYQLEHTLDLPIKLILSIGIL